MRKFLSLLLAVVMLCSLSSFAMAEETIKLTMWGGDLHQELLGILVEQFKAANPDQTFEIVIGVQSEGTARATVLSDIQAAADVFAFADDQINDLVTAGALQPVMIDAEHVIEANGGPESGAVLAASVDGVLYAYPMTASNGYFMYYDKSVFTADDVKTFDKMLEVAAAKDKKVTMQMGSAWYNYSFFKGAGLYADLINDGSNMTACNWNATENNPTGAQVVEAMLNIAKNPAFVALDDPGFQSAVTNGTVAAGINGTWNATVCQEAWGENYAAAKLPTYTVNGEQVQMGSFAGYKLVGVNAYSANVGWAMKLAQFITEEAAQTLRFEMTGEGPSNVVVATSEAVLAAPAIAALSEQSAFATAQRVGGNYWASGDTLGTIILNGNPDNIDLQVLVDNAVAGITAPVQ